MKCKNCKSQMYEIVSDEFLTVHACNGCDRVAIEETELTNEVQWYVPESK
jgi:hypothetical protein